MSIYKKTIDKELHNNKDYCYLKNINKDNIEINNLFNDLSQIYKHKVSIKTPNKEYNTYLIGKTNEYLVTFNDEKIYLKDIISIDVK